jgi:hypothetical protein
MTNEQQRLQVARERYAQLKADQHETYTILPDNRVEIDCEFGKWIYGGSWRSGADNQSRAQGVVSQLRYNAYWATVSQFDISREQD